MIGALVLRRVWVLLVCAAVAAAAAWFLGPREAPRQTQILAFVLRPDTNTPADVVPDSLRGTGGTSSQLTRTVARAIETARVVDAALMRPEVVPGGQYELGSSLEAGTDIVTVEVSAKQGVPLEPLITAYSRAASMWVTDSYKGYTLQFLDSSPGPSAGVGARAIQVTGLAALAGALLGLLFVFAEYKLRGLDLIEAGEDASWRANGAGPDDDVNGESPYRSWREADSDPGVGERESALSASSSERSGERPG